MALSTVYYVAASLDGFIAAQDGGVGWLDAYSAEESGITEFFAGVRGLILGRETHETALKLGGWPYGPLPSVVLTTRPLPDGTPETVEAVNGPPRAALDALAKRGVEGRVWIVGGGDVASQFLRAGLLDRLELHTVPVLLGRGIPLFAPMDHLHSLKLLESAPLKNGLVRSVYEPADRKS